MNDKPEDTPTATCRLCGDALHRVVIKEVDEWGWSDETGSIYGTDRDLRHLEPNPYAYLQALSDRYTDAKGRMTAMPTSVAGEYSMLMVRLDLGGTFHTHQPENIQQEPFTGELPQHCEWPAMLRPSGWQCRRCGERLSACQD